jgi:hypothetical protein
MGIDRWKQEHRNWRPNGVKVVVPEPQPDEPSAVAPPLVPSEKTSDTKPRGAKKQATSSSGSPRRTAAKVKSK